MVRDEHPNLADRSISMSKVNRDCDWVRARLPLWVGDGGGNQIEGLHEEGDLAETDRREIELHIGACTSCRLYRGSLERALAALLAAAADVSLEPAASSLWPALQHRIASHDIYVVSPWRRAARCIADQWARARTMLDREQPLRLRWIHDTVHEAFFTRKAPCISNLKENLD